MWVVIIAHYDIRQNKDTNLAGFLCDELSTRRRDIYLTTHDNHIYINRGADKSLARPGMKQSNVSVKMAWISFGALPWRKRDLMAARVSMLKSRASLTCFRACFFPGRAKDLLASRYINASCGPLALLEKKTGWQLTSWCWWNRARPWHASELFSFLVVFGDIGFKS